MQPETQVAENAGGKITAASAGLPNYFPQIDGLRTLAILGVILFHLRIPGMMLGWSGVWLFYVISGFLITGILLDSKGRPHFFRNFYARRVLRIFPIYFVCLFGLSGVALARGWTVRDIWYYVLYFQNHLLGSSQFVPAFPAAYNHTWTLAVEEQFYLFWPLVVWLLNLRRLMLTCVAMMFLAPLSRALLLHFTHNPFMALTPLVVNLDAFAAGGLLAMCLRSSRVAAWFVKDAGQAKRVCCSIWLIISAAILLLVTRHDRHAYWNPIAWLAKVDANILLTTVLSLWFSVLIFYVVVWDDWLRKALGSRCLVHFGKISYGIYIFHGLVLTYIAEVLGFLSPRLGRDRMAISLLNLVLPYLLARLSWRFIESPCLRLRKYFVSARPPVTG